MAFLSKKEKQTIADAIHRAESQTTGELVTVIARASDDYLYIPVLWAALLALLTPGLLMMFPLDLDYVQIYQAQVAVFFVAVLLFRLPVLKMRLIPKFVKIRRASRVAREQFIQQNLHHTAARTGVLIFVSRAEHYVEIIADKGINDVVPDDAWDKVVVDFVAKVKSGEVADGFLVAIDDCGKLLAEHFPGKADDENELPNHLVEL